MIFFSHFQNLKLVFSQWKNVECIFLQLCKNFEQTLVELLFFFILAFHLDIHCLCVMFLTPFAFKTSIIRLDIWLSVRRVLNFQKKTFFLRIFTYNMQEHIFIICHVIIVAFHWFNQLTAWKQREFQCHSWWIPYNYLHSIITQVYKIRGCDCYNNADSDFWSNF